MDTCVQTAISGEFPYHGYPFLQCRDLTIENNGTFPIAKSSKICHVNIMNIAKTGAKSKWLRRSTQTSHHSFVWMRSLNPLATIQIKVAWEPGKDIEMKIESLKKTATLAFLMVLMLLLHGVEAEEKSTKTSNDNSRIKLLYELTFPDCIETYSFEKDNDGNYQLGWVMTSKCIYKIDEERNLSPYMSREIEVNEWYKCGGHTNAFSPNSKIIVDTIAYAHESLNNYLITLEKKERKILKDSGGSPIFSENSILLLNTVSGLCELRNYEGEKLKEFDEKQKFSLAKGHRKGFVGAGPYYHFLDSKGNMKNRLNYQVNNFDVDYETGITAIIIPGSNHPANSERSSYLKIYNSKGDLRSQLKISFTGFTVGIGISTGGDYVAVTSHLGWLKLFDIKKEKELWSIDYHWGGHFTQWCYPIPISVDGKYVVVHGGMEGVSKNLNRFLIFDKSGQLIGYIEPIIPRDQILKYDIYFIPKTTNLICVYGKTASVYEILEGK